MATLVLTAVGTALGGPIGGAIGGIIGNQIDQRVFAPKGRQGPRLGELTVHTSSYGATIPKLFGTLRVAGTVIWATDLKEARGSGGGGKGQGSTTTYSYSASFAVLLSGRSIRSVGRIWADGKLLRGAAGDWKTATGFRVYPGDEDQPVDPLIAAIEGAEGAPAFRGLAYAVFEDLALADFGNRIPSLSFEVVADDGPVAVPAIAAALAGAGVAGRTGAAVLGYAASGESVRGAIETLDMLSPLSIVATDAGIAIGKRSSLPSAIDEAEIGTGAGGVRSPRRAVERQAAGTLPDEIAIAYYEPARDWQTGLQRARRASGPAARAERIELPAALEAGMAKAAAERALAERYAGRMTATLTLPWRRMMLAPGDALTLPGSRGTWRVARWTLDRMVVNLELVATTRVGVGGDASPGRATGGMDKTPGMTVLALLDLPALDMVPATTPRLAIAAAGTGGGWRRAALSASLDGGGSWIDLGGTAAPAVIGHAENLLGPGPSTLRDDRNAVDVMMANDAMWLESRTDDALATSANLAMLGNELIQFGTATPIGPRRFRLSRMLRGRWGSEWAAATHVAGERFVLIDPQQLVTFTPQVVTGATIDVLAQGIGDGADGVRVTGAVTGAALRPPAPVHLAATPEEGGALAISWTRRSRSGFGWIDGVDAPLAEERERYRLTIVRDADVPRIVEIDEPLYRYGMAERIADGLVGGDVIRCSVVQIGTHAVSLPSPTAIFTLRRE